MTAEILRNSLYKSDSLNVDCVIMDEVHFINDPDRGKIWEETIIMLPQSVQIIMLSATINNVESFAKWISEIREKKLSLIKSNKRIVPLNYYLYVDELFKISDSTDSFNDNAYFDSRKKYDKIQKERKQQHKSDLDKSYFDKVVKFLIKNDLLQSIFFSFSRNNCEKYANQIQSILSAEESATACNMFDNLMRNHKKEYEIIPQYIQIRNLISKGICFHHSGIIPILKEVIEIIFRNGFIKILFATETFAVGVNMPTRTVIFTELTKPTNMTKRFLNTAEFKQMSGRAGRRGKDVKGHVILLPYYEFPELSDLKSVMLQSMPSISSKFNVDYYYVLKTVSIDAEIYNKSLLQSEQHNMILTELRKISKTELELQNLKSNFNISDEDLKSIMREYELDNYTDFASLNLLLPKSLQKELRNLKNKNNRKEYDEYCNIKKLELDLDRKRQNISKIESYLDYTKSNIIDILIDNKYIKKEENKITLDIYGLCVINCNECNGILLIEMLKNNIFDGLESNDIICLLSIFASYKNENSNRFNKYYGDVYKFINNIKDIWMQRENKLNIFINNDFWETTDGYIDITYEWANNADISVIMNYLQEMEEYEGNFIKNMLKIYNVCLNFKKMCELLNKTDIILKLEDLDKKLLRNIVNVNSLYLN
jgi:superfamily II RNA helicase